MSRVRTFCSVPGCVAPTKAHRLCNKHLSRVQRHGSVEYENRSNRPWTADELWAYGLRTYNGCWEWPGTRDRKGYGQTSHQGKSMRVHRLAFFFTWGVLPADRQVCHHCDNPGCFRPEHLFLGTNSENQQDAKSKGRRAEQKQTHCRHGHEYTPENTRILTSGSRSCRTCSREQQLIANKTPGQLERERERNRLRSNRSYQSKKALHAQVA